MERNNKPFAGTLYGALCVIDGMDGGPHDAETIISAFQYLIDSRRVWNMHGKIQGSARALIASGLCAEDLPGTLH